MVSPQPLRPLEAPPDRSMLVAILPLFLVADSLLLVWNIQQTTQAYCSGPTKQPTCGSKEAWEKKEGEEDDRSAIVSPDHLVAGVG